MYHYKNILIISDNVPLTSRFQNWLTTRPEYEKVHIIFTKTIASHKNADDNDFVDLQNPADVKKIISDFDLVISLNCAQIFPEKLVSEIKCINIHPGYNP